MNSVNDQTGAIDALSQFITDHSALLTSKGLTPATLTTTLTAAKTDLMTKDSTQETAKTTLKNATLAVEAALAARGMEFSSMIDLLVGALGKTSNEAKQVQKIRKDLRAKRGSPSSSSSSSSNGCSSSGCSSSGCSSSGCSSSS